MARRFGVRENISPLREPLAHLALEHRLTVGRREALAVDHAHAAITVLPRIGDEVGQRIACIGGSVSVEVELALHGPMAAPQFGQYVAGNPAAEERLLAFQLLSDVPRVRSRLGTVL